MSDPDFDSRVTDWPALPGSLQHAGRAALRRHFRRARRALDPATQQHNALAVCRHVLGSGLLLSHRRIGLYLANDGELDPAPLMTALAGLPTHIALPVVTAGRLQFLPYAPGDPLQPNRYGIDEPEAASQRPWPTWSLDLVLTPLVAADRHGTRLGMGGGYYDRTFGGLYRGAGRRPLLIGLAHHLQCTSVLPGASWDVPLDGVITEYGFFAFSRRSRRFAGVVAH